MRRMTALLVGAVMLLAIGSCSSRIDVAAAAPANLQTASIPALSAPVKVPKAKFTRTMYAATQLAGASVMLDACHGPIAVKLGAGRPVLVAEHDYCGGSAWIPKLKVGDGVRLDGDGVYPGVYAVNEIRYQIRHEATVGDLPDAEAVLQTCVTKRKMVLVGLVWVGA